MITVYKSISNEKFFLIILLLFLITLNSELSRGTCILEDQTSEKNKFLDSISLLNDLKYLAVNNEFSYAVSICSDVSKGNHPNASVTRTHISKNTTTVLGRHNVSDIVKLQDNLFLLTYSEGDIINGTSSCNGTQWKTLILIACDYDENNINIDLLDPLNTGCFALFHLKTSACCSSNSGDIVKGWFILILLFICTAFIIGFFYKRFVKGAKGWEQVPFHDFLRHPTQHFTGISRSHESIPPRVVPNDPADEPLLRP